MGRPSGEQAGYELLTQVRESGNSVPFIIFAGSKVPQDRLEKNAARRSVPTIPISYSNWPSVSYCDELVSKRFSIDVVCRPTCGSERMSSYEKFQDEVVGNQRSACWRGDTPAKVGEVADALTSFALYRMLGRSR